MVKSEKVRVAPPTPRKSVVFNANTRRNGAQRAAFPRSDFGRERFTMGSDK